MSDFFNSGWSIYVAVATVDQPAGLPGAADRRQRAGKVMAGDNTTGHVWDEDLRELNNPLPRWWMWLFVLTVVFAGVYLALYPGLGSHAGHAAAGPARPVRGRAAEAQAAMAPVFAAKFAACRPQQLAKDPQGHGASASACSSTTARPATAPTRAAARASRT